ncbi:MAG: metallophosphoesterase [Bacilli bacterium]|nr:metallophosphoesterase [Bacilli bacterium]
MKQKILLLLTALPTICLTSCGERHYSPADYVLEMDYVTDFRVLQITDCHLGDKDDLQRHFDFMDLTINEADPDLIAVTGDLFTYASKTTAKKFLDYVDGHKVPWTVTFGNHDEQCFFSIDWLTNELNNYGSYCLFKDIQDDDVHGNCNFAINLMKDGKVFEQLIFMDSNRYYFGSYFGYDYFKQNQIDWYSALIDETTKNNDGLVVPSLMFYHIPLPEVNDAWAAVKEGTATNVNGGQQGEDPCNPKYNSHFFDVIKEKGSTKGMYFGHDHVNNYIVNYQGIDFGYGVKATDRVYYQDSILGGRVITIKEDHTMSYQDYIHTYEEVK